MSFGCPVDFSFFSHLKGKNGRILFIFFFFSPRKMEIQDKLPILITTRLFFFFFFLVKCMSDLCWVCQWVRMDVRHSDGHSYIRVWGLAHWQQEYGNASQDTETIQGVWSTPKSTELAHSTVNQDTTSACTAGHFQGGFWRLLQSYWNCFSYNPAKRANTPNNL